MAGLQDIVVVDVRSAKITVARICNACAPPGATGICTSVVRCARHVAPTCTVADMRRWQKLLPKAMTRIKTDHMHRGHLDVAFRLYHARVVHRYTPSIVIQITKHTHDVDQGHFASRLRSTYVFLCIPLQITHMWQSCMSLYGQKVNRFRQLRNERKPLPLPLLKHQCECHCPN